MDSVRVSLTYSFTDGSRIRWVFKPASTLYKSKRDRNVMLLTDDQGQIIGKPLVVNDAVIMSTGEDCDMVILLSNIIGWVYSPVGFLNKRFPTKIEEV